MQKLHFSMTPALISEAGALKNRLGRLCANYQAITVMIVTNPSMALLGHVQQAQEILESIGYQVVVFNEVESELPVDVVNAALYMARDKRCDLIVGLGGGSAIDTAKLVALAPNAFATVQDLIDQDLSSFTKLPLISIPTNPGTGAEVTCVSVLTLKDGSRHAIYSPKILPEVALLDAELTLGLPRHITSASALNAMVHAIEAYTSRTRKNPISDALAMQGLKLLWDNFPKVLADGQNIETRAAMLLGSTMVGMAFVNSSVAAIHGLSYPLGNQFQIAHGHANALVMTPVLRFNIPAAKTLYAQLAACTMGNKVQHLSESEAAEAFINQLEDFFIMSGLETKLSQLGVVEQDLTSLAYEMIQNYAPLIATNPRDMTLEEVESMYRSVLA